MVSEGNNVVNIVAYVGCISLLPPRLLKLPGRFE